MKKEVIAELSFYLQALPIQVTAWDKKVINYFLSHPEVFGQFRGSDGLKKWDIYHSIRYANYL